MPTENLNFRATADTTQAQSAFRGLDASIAGMIKNAVSIAGVVLAAKEAFDELADSVNKAAFQQMADVKLAQGIKASGNAANYTVGELKAMAASFQENSIYGDELIENVQLLALTFRTIGHDVMPQAVQAVMDMSSVMGTLETNSIMVFKALNEPIQGVTALRRVGVQLTDEQEELIRSFMDVNDVASAQQVILSELAMEFSGQAKAATSTYTGQVEQLKNSFGDLKEMVGATLIPVLGVLVGNLRTMVGHAQAAGREIRSLLGYVESSGADQIALMWRQGQGALEDYIKTEEGAANLQLFINRQAREFNTTAEQTMNMLGLKGYAQTAEDAASMLEDMYNRAGDAGERAREAAAKLKQQMDAMAASVRELGNALDEEMDKKIAQSIDPVNDLATALAGLRAAQEGAAPHDLIDALDAQYGEMIESTTKYIDEYTALNERMASAYASTITDMVMAGMDGMQSLGDWFVDFGKRAVAALIETIAYMTIFKALMSSMTPTGFGAMFLGNLFGFATGGVMDNVQGHPTRRAAVGMDWTVPSGYESDTFPVYVRSGERVQVTPAGSQQQQAPVVNVQVAVDPITGQYRAVSRINDRGRRARVSA